MVNKVFWMLAVLTAVIGIVIPLRSETTMGKQPLLAPRADSSMLDDPIQVLSDDNNYFLKIDLHDPRVHPQVMLANNDTGGLQSLYWMKKRLEGHARWAIVNGDLFSNGCPAGVNCAQGLTYIVPGQHKPNWSEYGETWKVRGNIGFDASNNPEISVGDFQTKRYMTIGGGPRVLMGGGSPTCNAIYDSNTGKTYFPDSGEYFDGDVRYWCSDTRAITAIGYSADRRYLYVGISLGGKTVTQLAQWLKDRGAYEILRLDSGSSSGMYYNGQFIGGTGGKPIADAFAIVIDSGSPPSSNHPPNTPSLQSPHDWYVSRDGKAPTICWNNPGDPDGDPVEFYAEVYESAVNASSGWIQNTCWRPAELDGQYYGYKWHVKAHDDHGAESGWSTTWHFNIEAPNAPPSISFDTANGDPFPSGHIESRDRTWTFSGTASDPEGHLDHIKFRCRSCDNSGSGPDQTTGNNWSLTRSNMSGRNEVYFVAYDDRGQSAESRHLDLRIDLAPPSTGHNLSGTTGENGWYVSPVEVHLHSNDGGTDSARVGVREIRYRLDGGSWQTHGGDDKRFTAVSYTHLTLPTKA